MKIKKTLRSPRTKVRGLSGFLDAQRAPRPKGRGFSKHVDIKKREESETSSKPLEKHPELLEDKETLHDLVTMSQEAESEEKENTIVKSQANPIKEIKI
ncbi:MAG: hypothetical protein AABY16_04550 [Nanoarchaeota archaeon]